MITRRSSNDVQVLCCNQSDLGPNYYLAEENSYRVTELGELFVSSEAKEIRVSIHHLDAHLTYMVRKQIVNHFHGSVIQEWLALNEAYLLTPGDVDYLMEKVQPKLERKVVYVEDGTLNLELRLEPNEIRWISIREARLN